MELVDRTLNTLLILSKESNGLSVSELSSRLDLPMSSTHRLLKALSKNHYVVQSRDTKRYRIGYKMLTLTSNISKENQFTKTARPYMIDLANDLDCTVTLCVLESNSIICLDYIEKEDTPVLLVKKGYAMPAHATSAGKAIQAFMSHDKVKDIYESSNNKVTGNTIVEFDEFRDELDIINKKGYAVSDEELQVGVQGVAAPIFDNNDKVVGAIAFTSLKISNKVNEDNISKLVASANDITQSIGGMTIIV